MTGSIQILIPRNVINVSCHAVDSRKCFSVLFGFLTRCNNTIFSITRSITRSINTIFSITRSITRGFNTIFRDGRYPRVHAHIVSKMLLIL